MKLLFLSTVVFVYLQLTQGLEKRELSDEKLRNIEVKLRDVLAELKRDVNLRELETPSDPELEKFKDRLTPEQLRLLQLYPSKVALLRAALHENKPQAVDERGNLTPEEEAILQRYPSFGKFLENIGHDQSDTNDQEPAQEPEPDRYTNAVRDLNEAVMDHLTPQEQELLRKYPSHASQVQEAINHESSHEAAGLDETEDELQQLRSKLVSIKRNLNLSHHDGKEQDSSVVERIVKLVKNKKVSTRELLEALLKVKQESK